MTEQQRTNYAGLLTEQRNPRSENLDSMSVEEIVQTMQAEDHDAVLAAGLVQDSIVKTVELVVNSFREGGRLLYIGAGTSGRLGVLDASECPPTFSTPPEMVVGIIAGGDYALRNSREGAEDEAEGGAEAIRNASVTPRDTVVGIASSGVTPYVRGALIEARKLGAKTAFLTCNPPGSLMPEVDVVIAPLVGPEILTGSTRLKAGTVTKLVLNRITTAAMVRMGKTYSNLMVDLTASCGKLVDRARRIVSIIAEVPESEADALLHAAGGSVKVAVIMSKLKVTQAQAERLLSEADGFLRRALEKGVITAPMK